MLRNKKVFLLDHDELSRSMILKSLTSEVNYLKVIDDLQMVNESGAHVILMLDEEYLEQDLQKVKEQLVDFEEALKVVLTDDQEDCFYEFGDRTVIIERPFSIHDFYDQATKYYVESKNPFVEKALYDLSKLRDMARGNEDFILKMVHIFCKDIPESLEKATVALMTHEYPKIKAVLHRIKPSVKMLEIHSVIPLLELTEQRAASESELEEISRGIHKLKSDLGVVVEQLSKEFKINVG